MNPWQPLLAPAVPQWRGASSVHLMDDDKPAALAPPAKRGEPTAEDWGALHDLQQRAASAILQACPAWGLLTPAKERLTAQVSPALWWPPLGEDA